MTYEVRQSDTHAFDRDGAVPLRQVVGEDWLKKLADAIEDDIRVAKRAMTSKTRSCRSRTERTFHSSRSRRADVS